MVCHVTSRSHLIVLSIRVTARQKPLIDSFSAPTDRADRAFGVNQAPPIACAARVLSLICNRSVSRCEA
jgi:hypothetical protein